MLEIEEITISLSGKTSDYNPGKIKIRVTGTFDKETITDQCEWILKN